MQLVQELYAFAAVCIVLVVWNAELQINSGGKGCWTVNLPNLPTLWEKDTQLNSTQSLFANNRKYRKTQQYNTKWQVAREA